MKVSRQLVLLILTLKLVTVATVLERSEEEDQFLNLQSNGDAALPKLL